MDRMVTLHGKNLAVGLSMTNRGRYQMLKAFNAKRETVSLRLSRQLSRQLQLRLQPTPIHINFVNISMAGHLNVHTVILTHSWKIIFIMTKIIIITMKTTHVNLKFRLYVTLILSIELAVIATGRRRMVNVKNM